MLKIANPIDATNVKMQDGANAETAIKGKQDVLTKGTYVGSLDDLYTPGWYWCHFGDDVTGSPYTSGFGYTIVEAKISQSGVSQSCIQKIYRFNSGITDIAIRPRTNNQWYPWRKVVTTEI